MNESRSRRGLATARSVLHVLRHLEQHPVGVRADAVAHVVGKSSSTAYYLLASLVEEGFAVHDRGLYRPRSSAPHTAPADPLEDAVDDLFLRARKRSYLGVVRRGAVEITIVRGRQGIARMPGLGTRITDNAHALAMGKVVLSRLRPGAVADYAARGLEGYTPATITTLPGLVAELDRVRCTGYAVDREEFDEDFCCVAAPVTDERGVLRGIVGLSSTVRAFEAEHDQLVDAVREVAVEASWDTNSNIVHKRTTFLSQHRGAPYGATHSRPHEARNASDKKTEVAP